MKATYSSEKKKILTKIMKPSKTELCGKRRENRGQQLLGCVDVQSFNKRIIERE
jgi:hypothetical protein